MVRKVNLPDGNVGNFPDSMSDDEISAVLSKQFGSSFGSQAEEFPSSISRLGSGVSEGLLRVGEGAGQLGLGAASAVSGLLPEGGIGGIKSAFDSLLPETAGGQQLGQAAPADAALSPEQRLQQFTQDVSQRRQAFDVSPVGQSAEGEIGQFLGEAAPFAAVPGGLVGGLLRRAATSGLAGAGIGAAQFVPEGESRLANVATGAAVGAALPPVLSGIGKLLGRTGTKAAIDPSVEKAAEIAQREGVPIFKADVSGPTAQKAAVLLEAVPGIGAISKRLKQAEAAKTAAERFSGRLKEEAFSESFGGKSGFDKLVKSAGGTGKRSGEALKLLENINKSGDEWQTIIKTSGNVQAFRKKLVSDRLYNRVDTLSKDLGDVPLTSTIKSLDTSISNAQKSAVPNTALINKLQALKKNLGSTSSFDSLRITRSDLGSIVRDAKKGVIVGDRELGIFSSIQNSVDKDLDKFFVGQSTEIKQAWQKANKFYKTNVVPFKDKQLGKALSQEGDPEKIFGSFVARTKTTQDAQRFYNALDNKGRAAVRFGIVDNALKSSLRDSGVREVFSQARFVSELNKLEKGSKVFFSKTAKEELDGFKKLMKITERAGAVAENPPTGNRFVQLALGGGAAVVAPQAAVTGAAVAVGMRSILLKDVGRKLLRDAAKARTPKQINAVRQKAIDFMNSERVQSAAARGAAVETTREGN